LNTDIIHIVVSLFFVFFFVVLNGFFVASEFAIVKVRSTRILQLSQEGNIRAKIAHKMIENLDAYLSATQLGITLSSLALGWIGEPFLSKVLEPLFVFIGIPSTWLPIVSISIAFCLITFLHIVIGEIAPKSLAIRKAESTTLWVSYPLHLFFIIFQPTIRLLNASADLILRLLRIELVPDHQFAHTEEEIRMVVEQSHRGGLIDQTELSLFGNIFDFTSRIGREIMVPRVNMYCLYVNNTFEQNMTIVKKGYFTRFPLCRRDKDDIIGIIHIRDLYEQLIEGHQPHFRKIARSTVLVPETMEIKDILCMLQKNKTEMAIVVDE
jgi:CBS domain containing-hemolysin-like protein